MLRRFPLLLLLTVVVLYGDVSRPGASTPLPDKVFVLVGDEQALGRGVPLSAGETPVPTLLAYENGGWQTAVDPVAQAPTPDDGVGPAMSLGKTALAELGGPSVGLVNCGTPKTAMTSWQGNKLLYRKCVDAARPFSGRIAGIFFVEGTWDSTKKTIGSTWLKSFRKTLTAFRNDLGADIPAVVAELGNIQGHSFKYVANVQAAQAQAPTVGNTSVVPTSSLPVAANGVDFTVDSYKTVGELLASAWWNERAQPIVSLAPPDQVFILAGQSNMLGRGQPSSSGAGADPSLWNWRAAFWRVAHDPLGTPTDPDNGVGPGMTFGKDLLAAEPGQRIGIVMCARGSTSMDAWLPGQGPYENCVRQATATGGTVRGILFLQGEADASQSKLASTWAAKFQKMLAGFRSVFGPNLPAVIGEIGNIAKKGNKYAPIVRAQQELAATQNTHVAVFSTLDLPIGPDGLHFTVPAYFEVGHRFASHWLSGP
jgi:carbohydrate esterase-like sialic acid-specific acetylesterase